MNERRKGQHSEVHRLSQEFKTLSVGSMLRSLGQ
jgi:hypothetical protein